MLSIENPPPDPLEISQLKSSDDEKIKVSSDKLALPEVDLDVEVKIDLLKSSLDDNKNNNKNPFPKFSIRDYVFSARSKDITASWPFSEKNLQLCLKHGVKELLPPFQPLDSVRNLSKRCVVYDNLLDQENLSKTNGEPSRQSDQYVSVSSDGAKCNQTLALDRVHIISSRSDQKEREFPFTEEQAHPEVDSGADTLLESSSKHVEAAILPETRKTDSIIQPPVKKCRLIVKLSNLTGSSTKEDNMPNSFMVSETMASKVCPVCKTFSSSSNTTLNAHIDQCLSGESTMKWTADPKVNKHRIKPRKTRLMVDIYATAQYCTLEDLDRRNGTSWATNSTLPAQGTELCIEERVQRVSTVAPEETGQEGAVYIDTDGTKVRILSKFSEALKPKVGEDPGHRKLLKGDKGSKFLIAKKRKKPNVQKNQKFLKLAPRGNSCSPKPCPSVETRGDQERNSAMEQNDEKEVRWGQRVKAQEQIKLDDSGIIRRWVCSKRTGLTKKNTDQDDHQHSGRNKDLLCESNQSSLPPKNPHLSKNLSSFPQSSKRMVTASYEPGAGLCREQPNLRKGEEFSLLGSRGVGYGKRSMILPKLKKLRKEGISVHDSCKYNPNYAASASSLGNKAVEISAAPAKTSDASFVSSKPSCSHQTFFSKATKFSSKRKKLLSKSQASMLKSKSDFKRKHSSPSRSQVHRRSELIDDLSAWPSQVDDDEQFDTMQEDYNEKQLEMEVINNKLSRSSTRVLKIRKNRGAIKVSRKEEAAVGLTSSLSEPLYYGHGVSENMDYSSVKFGCALEDTPDDEDSVREEVLAHGEHIAFEPSSKTAVGGSFMSSSNSLDREFNDLPSPTAQQCAEVNQGHLCGPECPICPNERRMGDKKQELFSSDEVGDVMIGDDIHMGAESDSKDEQANYFSEVDPIPIPGPPGSFLPSPGHMESEDLQGNSSSTTCRVQSMDDQHDLVDRDLSDSPVSAISGISNPTFARSESRSSEKFFVGPHTAQDDTRQGFSSAGVDPVVENFVPVSQAANFRAERPNLDTLRVNAPVSLKTEQPCCCSRKEGASLGVALNFQESQLLRRRTMASVSLPGKQIDSDSSKRHSNLNSRSEMFSLTNFPNSRPEKVVHHSMKLAAGNIPIKVSADPEVKFPIRGGDHDSASPSASNPVLRLMGKNLMVVSKDEDVSRQLRQQCQSSSVNGHPNLQSCTDSGVSHCGSGGNEDYHSFHQAVPQGPMIFSHDRHDAAVGQHFDARLLNNFRSNIDFKTATTPFHALGVVFPSMNTASGAFKASLEQHGEYKGGSNMLGNHEHRLKNRLDKPFTYDLDKNVATSRPPKEIIIIDDVPENEAESVIDAMCNEGMRRYRASSSGVSVPRTSDYSSRLVNPFYSNQLDGGGSMYGGRPVLHNASFQMPTTAGGNASPAKWNCNPEGSSMRHQSSFGAPLSAGHLRPTFYYSPSFS